jgi:predicted peroxiredoxin
MSEFLAIPIFSEKYFDYAVELVKAAKKLGKEVKVFMSGDGVKNVKHPKFKEMVDTVGADNFYICEASYRRYVGENMEKLKQMESPVEGIPYKNWVTQAKNAEFLTDADRYVVF